MRFGTNRDPIAFICLCLAASAVPAFAQDASKDSWVGQKVFYKESAVARVDGKPVDKWKLLAFPAKVEEEKDGQLWLGRAWLPKRDCMLLPDALPHYADQLRQNPTSSRHWYRRGICFAELGDLKKAIEDFDESIRLNPEETSAYNARGGAKYHLGDLHSAIRDYDKAIKLNPKDARNFDNRGLAKNALKDYRAAIADYDEAIKLDPKFAPVYNNRANSKRALKDLAGAVADYTESIRLNANDPWPYNNRGWILLLRGDYQSALRDLDEAIRLDSKAPFWRINKAFLLSVADDAAIRNPQLALELVESVVKEMPHNGYTLNCQSCALAAQGKFTEAIAAQKSAAKDREWSADDAIDGGAYSQNRLAAWEQKKLWSPPKTK